MSPRTRRRMQELGSREWRKLAQQELVRTQRNLNPHKAAVLAMTLWGERYSRQMGGSMDFWDSLTASERRLCLDTIKRIAKAPDARR